MTEGARDLRARNISVQREGMEAGSELSPTPPLRRERERERERAREGAGRAIAWKGEGEGGRERGEEEGE